MTRLIEAFWQRFFQWSPLLFPVFMLCSKGKITRYTAPQDIVFSILSVDIWGFVSLTKNQSVIRTIDAKAIGVDELFIVTGLLVMHLFLLQVCKAMMRGKRKQSLGWRSGAYAVAFISVVLWLSLL